MRAQLALPSTASANSAANFLGSLHTPLPTRPLAPLLQLLSGGRLVFHGPREAVLPFFEGLGFACPLGKGAADFLQEVTSFGEQRVRGAHGGTCGRLGGGWVVWLGWAAGIDEQRVGRPKGGAMRWFTASATHRCKAFPLGLASLQVNYSRPPGLPTHACRPAARTVNQCSCIGQASRTSTATSATAQSRRASARPSEWGVQWGRAQLRSTRCRHM